MEYSEELCYYFGDNIAKIENAHNHYEQYRIREGELSIENWFFIHQDITPKN
jgi:hypothetical protein